MTRYRVEIETSVAKQIQRLQRTDQKRVMTAITALGAEPRPHGCTKLSGTTDAYRVRLGNFRIVYVIDDGVHIVYITRVAHRREAYKR